MHDRDQAARRRQRWTALLLLVALAGTACGSRRTNEELHAALQVEATVAEPAAERDDTTSPGTTDVAPTPTGVGTATVDELTPGGSTAAPVTTEAPTAADDTAVGTPVEPTPDPADDPVSSEAPSSPANEPRAPVVIGSVGPLSGLAGSTLSTGVDGLRVWVQWINGNGGLNGHPVELIAVDDQADPARHRALVQELVDERGVVAFVQNGLALSGQSAISFHQERQIPVIGSEGGSQYMYENSMYFPQMSTGDHLVLMQIGSTATYAQANGVTKYGSLVCQEAQVCRDSARLNAEYADDFGLDLVYSGQASLAKPDFTSECLNAQSAGVEIFGVGLDANSLTRLAASCARQGFFPVYAAAASIASKQHEDDPNITTLVSGSPVAPFPRTDVPAVKQMRDAFATYAPDVQVFTGHMTGWVAGKLLERAASGIQAPTTAAILEGLWSIEEDDLDGLTYPLTFTEGGTAARATCWWPVVIEQATYEAPFGPEIRCREVL